MSGHVTLLLFLLRQLIYNYPEQMFAAAGVMAIEHADFVGVERLALVTGTQTLSGAHPENCIPACTAVWDSFRSFKLVQNVIYLYIIY